MSKEADEAFAAWCRKYESTDGFNFGGPEIAEAAWRAAWAEKQRRDLAAVQTLSDMFAIEPEHAEYSAGYEQALKDIAARIKGDRE